jgi:hypothetical protein
LLVLSETAFVLVIKSNLHWSYFHSTHDLSMKETKMISLSEHEHEHEHEQVHDTAPESLSVNSVTYSLSPTSRRSAVALAVPLTGIGAEQLRPERRRTVFRPFFSALTKIKEVDPGRHELQ